MPIGNALGVHAPIGKYAYIHRSIPKGLIRQIIFLKPFGEDFIVCQFNYAVREYAPYARIEIFLSISSFWDFSRQ